MALIVATRRVQDPNTGVQSDITLGRGGILLKFHAIWAPRSYVDVQLPSEAIKSCDIHVLLIDSATNLPIIGQRLTPADPIIVRSFSEFEWQHPRYDEIIAGQNIIEKLAIHSSSALTVGAILGNFRAIISKDPIRIGTATEAAIVYTVEILQFDANAT